MYKAPIELIIGDMNSRLEDGVLKAINNCGVNVDKEQLIMALKNERYQYEKGYNDGVIRIKENKECLIKKLRAKQRGYLDLYDEYMDGEDYRNAQLLEEVINIVKETL